MSYLPKLAAALAIALGPVMVHAAELPQDARSSDATSNPQTALRGVGMSQTLEALPGTAIPAVLAGTGGAALFAGVALGVSSTTTTSTTGTN